MCRSVLKSESLNFLKTSEPVHASNEIALHTEGWEIYIFEINID